MQDQPILSICIPTTNRGKTLYEHLLQILSVKRDDFDIIVYDGRSSDGTYELVKSINDERIKFYRNDSETVNFRNQCYGALEKADGIFALHLNDRDIIVSEELGHFIDFLKKNKSFSGGVCKYLSNHPNNIICNNFQNSLMNIPFFSVHTTGVVFCV